MRHGYPLTCRGAAEPREHHDAGSALNHQGCQAPSEPGLWAPGPFLRRSLSEFSTTLMDENISRAAGAAHGQAMTVRSSATISIVFGLTAGPLVGLRVTRYRPGGSAYDVGSRVIFSVR